MRSKAIFIALLLFPLIGSAQLIDPSAPADFHHAPAFHAPFLKANTIRGIEVEFHTKRDGEPMRPRNESDLFEFDSEGKPTLHRKIRSIIGTPDTSQVLFLPGDCRVRIERHNRYIGAVRECTIVSETTIEKFTLRDFPSHADQIESLRLSTLFSESITAEPSDGRNHTYTYKNDLGLPFKRIRYLTDEKGYLQSVIEEGLVISGTKEKRYAYDELGRIESITEFKGPTIEKTFLFKRDGMGNILTIEETAGGKNFLTEIVYGSDAMIHSYIRINRETNEMIIARFRYFK
jgi:hypothetical protein